MSLSERLKGINCSPIHQSKIAGVSRYFEARNLFEDSVKCKREKLLRSRLALPTPPLSVYDIVPFVPPREHLGNELGRILKIGIEDHHYFALGLIQSTRDGELMTEVTREADSLDEALFLRVLTDEWPRVVFASVIDEYHLERVGISNDQSFETAS
jgi:hypothetical protein